MFTIYTKSFITKFLFITLFLLAANALFAQNKQEETQQVVPGEITEFTYQGKLLDNNLPANGTYDFQFRLTDGNTGTSAQELILGTVQRNNVQVVNGIFTVRLDFGQNFPAGQARFLEIGVKPVGTAAYTPLTPAQPITATPFAVHSADASNALFAGDSNKLGGMTADQFVLIGDPRLTDDRNPLPGSANYIQNTTNQQTANFNVSGNGTIGGDLTVAGTTSFNIINAQTQYNFGSQRFLSGSEQSGNVFAGFDSGNSTMTGVSNSFFGIRAGKLVTSGYANVFLGSDSGAVNTTGNSNVFVGVFAGYENQTGNSNTFVGFEAGKLNKASGNAFFGTGSGYSNTTGDSNSFFGFQSGNLNTSGIDNSFFGTYAGATNKTGGSNAFFGTGAGYANQTGSQNSFFGYQSGNNSLGAGNTFYGYQSGLANTSGSNNTIIGADSNVGSNNLTFATAIGAGAVVSANNTIVLGRTNGADTVSIPGNLNVSGTTTFSILNAQTQYNLGGQRFLSGNEQSGNVFAGFGAGNTATTGVSNSFFGIRAGNSITSGVGNVFLGGDSGLSNTTGNLNIFIGTSAGRENQTGGGNTVIGNAAGRLNNADSNSFFGESSGGLNTTGTLNAFFGAGSGYSNIVGNANSFFGFQSGTNSLGANNSFFGYRSGLTNTTGSNNTTIGAGADFGANNLTFATAIGSGAVVNANNTIALGRANGADTVLIPGNLTVNGTLGFNILNAQTQYNLGGSRFLSGDEQSGNIFAGFNSGGGTTGGNNSFFGAGTGALNTSGFSNVFIGNNAGGKNTIGYYNTAVGVGAANSNTSGIQNSFFGFLSGSGNTTGTNNVFIGYQAGSFNTTGSNNTFIGTGANVNTGGLTNATAIGSGAVVDQSNAVVIGRNNDSVKIPGYFFAYQGGWFSSINVNGQAVVDKLSVNTFTNNGYETICRSSIGELGHCSSSIRYKKDVEDFTSGLDVIRRLRPVTFRWKDSNLKDLGFIAEEVNQVEPLMTTYNEQGEIQGVKYDRISTALVNAVNEQQTEIESQKKQIEEQKTLIETQQKQIDALTKAICAQNPKAEICGEKK